MFFLLRLVFCLSFGHLVAGLWIFRLLFPSDSIMSLLLCISCCFYCFVFLLPPRISFCPFIVGHIVWETYIFFMCLSSLASSFRLFITALCASQVSITTFSGRDDASLSSVNVPRLYTYCGLSANPRAVRSSKIVFPNPSLLPQLCPDYSQGGG